MALSFVHKIEYYERNKSVYKTEQGERHSSSFERCRF